MQTIKNKNFPNERDLYGANGVRLVNCTFDGIEDGESALKESQNISLEDCFFNLRYPLWHGEKIRLTRVTMTDFCRAALWYTQNAQIDYSRMLGIKAVRECENVCISHSEICSPEFGWKSRNLNITQSDVASEYCFLLSSYLALNGVNFKGKYSFQYTENVLIENSILETKDAFWHAKNVTVKNCVVKGEYQPRYSENVTFIDCTIVGTQPLCYCKNLKLVNCKLEEADLAFEYSEVEAELIGSVLSVKNPKAGKIVADRIGEIIYTQNSKYESRCTIIQKQAA